MVSMVIYQSHQLFEGNESFNGYILIARFTLGDLCQFLCLLSCRRLCHHNNNTQMEWTKLPFLSMNVLQLALIHCSHRIYCVWHCFALVLHQHGALFCAEKAVIFKLMVFFSMSFFSLSWNKLLLQPQTRNRDALWFSDATLGHVKPKSTLTLKIRPDGSRVFEYSLKWELHCHRQYFRNNILLVENHFIE